MRVCAIFLLVLAAVPACKNTDKMLDDVTWGREIEGDYLDVLDRARLALRKEFPKGLDPDRTDEGQGELFTVWHHYASSWYRKTKRKRAHVRIEDMGKGKCRIGVSVVEQTNNNIDNPSVISEAKWVATTKDQETATRVEQRIAKRYLKDFKPSEAWEEKHRRDKDKRKGLRDDLVDRYEDVDLEDEKAGTRGGLPTTTSKQEYWDPKKKKK